MSGIPDPFHTLLGAIIVAAAMVAATPHLFVDWLRRHAEQQRAAVLWQQAIQEDLLRRLAIRDSGPSPL